MTTRKTEIRNGERNIIRTGDDVKFQERPGERWETATFLYADQDKGGTYYAIRIHNGPFRFVRPPRIKRVTERKQRTNAKHRKAARKTTTVATATKKRKVKK